MKTHSYFNALPSFFSLLCFLVTVPGICLETFSFLFVSSSTSMHYLLHYCLSSKHTQKTYFHNFPIQTHGMNRVRESGRDVLAIYVNKSYLFKWQISPKSFVLNWNHLSLIKPEIPIKNLEPFKIILNNRKVSSNTHTHTQNPPLKINNKMPFGKFNLFITHWQVFS